MTIWEKLTVPRLQAELVIKPVPCRNTAVDLSVSSTMFKAALFSDCPCQRLLFYAVGYYAQVTAMN